MCNSMGAAMDMLRLATWYLACCPYAQRRWGGSRPHAAPAYMTSSAGSVWATVLQRQSTNALHLIMWHVVRCLCTQQRWCDNRHYVPGFMTGIHTWVHVWRDEPWELYIRRIWATVLNYFATVVRQNINGVGYSIFQAIIVSVIHPYCF